MNFIKLTDIGTFWATAALAATALAALVFAAVQVYGFKRSVRIKETNERIRDMAEPDLARSIAFFVPPSIALEACRENVNLNVRKYGLQIVGASGAPINPFIELLGYFERLSMGLKYRTVDKARLFDQLDYFFVEVVFAMQDLLREQYARWNIMIDSTLQLAKEAQAHYKTRPLADTRAVFRELDIDAIRPRPTNP